MKKLALFALCFSLSTPAFAGRTTCELPADQGQGSFAGAWAQLPVHLVLDAEFYNTNQGRDARAIKRAIATWNRWAAAKGKIAFVVDDDGQGMDIPYFKDCAQSSYTEYVRDRVAIWKISGDRRHANQRESCPRTPTGMGKILANGVQGQTDWIVNNTNFEGASVLLNFEEFNAPGKPKLDVESVALHQLGYVLGLLHSCNGSTGDSVDMTSAPACHLAPKEYLDAVMFPFLEIGQKRRSLGKNDFDRINCLY